MKRRIETFNLSSTCRQNLLKTTVVGKKYKQEVLRGIKHKDAFSGIYWAFTGQSILARPCPRQIR